LPSIFYYIISFVFTMGLLNFIDIAMNDTMENRSFLLQETSGLEMATPVINLPGKNRPTGINMTKSDLIETLSRKENLTEKAAADIVNLIFQGFMETLKKGDRIEIRGFGSYAVREYQAYTGRNPKTGKTTDVKPKKLPFFKAGKELKAKVNTPS